MDTGIFEDHRYFDVFTEYAKAGPEDICIRITAANRGPDEATLHLLPTVWFRNTWSWDPNAKRPFMHRGGGARAVIELEEPLYGKRRLIFEGDVPLLFTENETNGLTPVSFVAPRRRLVAFKPTFGSKTMSSMA